MLSSMEQRCIAVIFASVLLSFLHVRGRLSFETVPMLRDKDSSSASVAGQRLPSLSLNINSESGADGDAEAALSSETLANTELITSSPFVAPSRSFFVGDNGDILIPNGIKSLGGSGGAAGFHYGDDTSTGLVGNFPAMAGVELGIAVGVLEPCSANRPHFHPNVHKWGTVLKGTLEINVVGESGDGTKVFSSLLSEGESFWIPKGAVHFFVNRGAVQAATIGGSSGSGMQSTSFVALKDYSTHLNLHADFRDDGAFFLRLNTHSCQQHSSG